MLKAGWFHLPPRPLQLPSSSSMQVFSMLSLFTLLLPKQADALTRDSCIKGRFVRQWARKENKRQTYNRTGRDRQTVSLVTAPPSALGHWSRGVLHTPSLINPPAKFLFIHSPTSIKNEIIKRCRVIFPVDFKWDFTSTVSDS